jgi:hypothetical protein
MKNEYTRKFCQKFLEKETTRRHGVDGSMTLKWVVKNVEQGVCWIDLVGRIFVDT